MLRLLTHNLGWKLLALGLATLLWFGMVGDTDLAAGISVPIQFKDMPSDLEISSEMPEKLALDIRGPSRKLTAAKLADTVCRLDLSSVKAPGERTLTVRAQDINLPPGVSLARAIPSQLQLRFERTVARDIPVKLRLAGPPPQGFRLVRYELKPDRVRILGPESKVNQVESAQTDPVDLAPAGADTEFKARLYVGNPRVRFASNYLVTVRILIERIPEPRH